MGGTENHCTQIFLRMNSCVLSSVSPSSQLWCYHHLHLNYPASQAVLAKLTTSRWIVIEFARRKLKLANDGLLRSCAISPVEGTFSTQVVAGTIFRFDLRIQNFLGSQEICATAPETCHMAVFKPSSSTGNENPNLQVLVGGDDYTRCTREPVKSNMYK